MRSLWKHTFHLGKDGTIPLKIWSLCSFHMFQAAQTNVSKKHEPVKWWPIASIFCLIPQYWFQTIPKKDQEACANGQYRNRWSRVSKWLSSHNTQLGPDSSLQCRLSIMSRVFSLSIIKSHANTFSFGRHLDLHMPSNVTSFGNPSKRKL
jgi:hypothetical protein